MNQLKKGGATMNTPQTVKQMIAWWHRLGRPPLPNCPTEAATVGKEPKQPAYISGWNGKEPIVKPISWKHFQDSLPGEPQIKVWFKNPKVGISTLGGFNGKHYRPNGTWNVSGGSGAAVDDFPMALAGAALVAKQYVDDSLPLVGKPLSILEDLYGYTDVESAATQIAFRKGLYQGWDSFGY